jgi:hypothetical protein
MLEDLERVSREYKELLEQRNLIEKTTYADGEVTISESSYLSSSPGQMTSTLSSSPRKRPSLTSSSPSSSPSSSYGSLPNAPSLSSSPSWPGSPLSLASSAGLRRLSISGPLPNSSSSAMINMSDSVQESIEFQYGSVHNVLPRGFTFGDEDSTGANNNSNSNNKSSACLSQLGVHAAKRIMCLMNKDNKKILPADMSK